MGLVSGGSGTLGDFVMKALKRDAGVRHWGSKASVTGAVGLLDRVAPLCFAAPVFFHSVRWYFGVMTMRILGIDPGLRTTGLGVLDVEGPALHYVASGTIRTDAVDSGQLPLRLKVIFDGVGEVVARYRPQCASVEIVFVNVNPQSTLLLGQARGAAITALVAHDIAGGRVHRAANEEGRRRPRPRPQGTGAGHGVAPARAARPAGQGRRRRAGPGGLPRPCGALVRRHRTGDATGAQDALAIQGRPQLLTLPGLAPIQRFDYQ